MNYHLLSIIFIAFHLCFIDGKYTSSLTNGIIGQIRHLFSHQCLNFDGRIIFVGSCFTSNDNNLFQIQYQNPSTDTNFFLLTYSRNSDSQYIAYESTPYIYLTPANNYCLNSQCSNNYNYNYGYYQSVPGNTFKFYANFSKGLAKTPSGSFTLNNANSKKCFFYQFNSTGGSGGNLTNCDQSDFNQIFGFVVADVYLMNQITSSITTESEYSVINIVWSNPNKYDQVDYMVIPGNQSISEQGTLVLENIKCTTKNALSPITFQKASDLKKISTSLTLSTLKACNIYANKNDTHTTYEMKAIHVFLDNEVGFSRTIQIFFKNEVGFEQMYLVGLSVESSDKTQIFESSISSYEIVNKISLSFPQSIGQTYLENKIHNLNITTNSTSAKYSLSLVGNSMTLISVNASNNQIVYQTLPCTSQTSGVNMLNATFDFSNVSSNYYKFKLSVKLTPLYRVLQNENNSDSKVSIAEINTQEIYYIGTNVEIQDLLLKLSKLDKDKSNDSNDSPTVIALAVVLSLLFVILIIGVVVWKKKKISGKKESLEKYQTEKVLSLKNLEEKKDDQKPQIVYLKDEESNENKNEQEGVEEQENGIPNVNSDEKIMKEKPIGIFLFDD